MSTTKHPHSLLLAVALIALPLFISSPHLAQGTEITWNGPIGGTGNWSDFTKWSPQQVPGGADDVIIASFGSVNLDISPTIGSLTLDHGAASLGGAGDLTVTGMTAWLAGTIQGTGTLHANGGLDLTGSPLRNLRRPLHNAGLATWNGGAINIQSGGEFRNLAGATFDAQTNGSITISGVGPFINEGIFIKSGGSSDTGIGNPFNNNGVVEVQVGTLRFNRGGVSTGDFTGPHNLNMGGDHTLTGNITVNHFRAGAGGGEILVDGAYDVNFTSVGGSNLEFGPNATLTSMGDVNIFQSFLKFNTGDPVTLPTLTLTTGALSGSDDVTVVGALEWFGGSMGGTGTTTAEGGLTIGGGLIKNLSRTLNNVASGTWRGRFGGPSGNLQIGTFGAGEFNNAGSFDVQADNMVIGGVINNSGTFTKSAGTGEAQLLATFNNSGTVDVQSGSLLLRNGGSSAGDFIGTGTLALRGTHVLDGSVTVSTLVVKEGFTTITAPFTNAGGTVEVQIDGTLDFTVSFTQTAGATIVDGALLSPIIDIQGGSLTGSGTVNNEIINLPPVAATGGPYNVAEGGSILLAGSGSDPDADPVDYEWDLDNNGTFETPGQNPAFSAASRDGPDSQIVVLRVCDDKDACATDATVVNISNVGPSVGPISAPVAPVELGTPIIASANFTDPGIADTHTAVWDWGDTNVEPGTLTQGAGSGSVDDSHTYGATGVYTVGLEVLDDDGGEGTSVFEFVVVFDPSSGFVTGGGWVDSPEGAYIPAPALTGRATFGFVSKYKKGTTVPTGNTEFQFRAADLNFHSFNYEWLVVTGSDYARFKGSGTINGLGNYRFMVWAGDGEPDTFRIKIWEESELGIETVIYDNGFDQAIRGGSIVVHKK